MDRKLIVEWKLPIRAVSELNGREHWAARRKRHQGQKDMIAWAFATNPVILPNRIHVHLTRISPRELDDDNLVSSFKNIRDYIASCIHPEAVVICMMKNGKYYENPGHADKGNSIKWFYRQEKGEPKEFSIKIRIYDALPISS